MNWKKPDEEVPPAGATVWIIEAHIKRIRPMSFALHAGRVRYGNDGSWIVQQSDEAGQGCAYWGPDDIYAWSYDDDSFLPYF